MRKRTRPEPDPAVGERWRQAREDAGLRLDDVLIEFRDVHPTLQVGRSRLSRLENGEYTEIPAASLAALARLYDKPLAEIDPEIASEVEAIRHLVAVPNATERDESPPDGDLVTYVDFQDKQREQCTFPPPEERAAA